MKMQDLRILVVDDDEMFRRLTAGVFRKLCHTTIASSGNKAFEILQQEKFDIVFSDVCMPDGSGVELLEKLRAISATEPLVVLLTGYSMLTLEETLERGAHAVINKPFRRDALIEIVEKFLASKKEAIA